MKYVVKVKKNSLGLPKKHGEYKNLESAQSAASKLRRTLEYKEILVVPKR